MQERRAWSWRQMLLKSSLPGTTRHVLLTLSCHVNDAGEPCYPTVDRLVCETGLSKRSVLDALKKGKEAGWIEVGKHGFGDGRHQTNEYRLAWPDVVESENYGAPPAPLIGNYGAPPAPSMVHQLHHSSGPLYKGVSHSIPKQPTRKRDVVDNFFEQFWSLWPSHRRKVGKAKCVRLWQRRDLDRKAAQILAVLQDDIDGPEWTKDGGNFVPMPYTWLSQDRFERALNRPQRKEGNGLGKCEHCDQPAVIRYGHNLFCAKGLEAYKEKYE